MNPEDELTEEQLLVRAQARERLDAEVRRVKEQEEAGERPLTTTQQERYAAINASQNIVSVGDALAPVVDRLGKLAAETTAFCTKIRQEILKASLQACEFHECELTVNEERTFFESRVTGQLEIVYDGCPKCKAESESSLVNEKWRKMGIPEKVRHATFVNFECSEESQTKALVKVQRQVNTRKGFIIIRGTVGTGKTHLAAASIKWMGDGLFVTEGDLIGELRATYTDNTNQQKLVDKYRRVSVLVIDELSVDVKGADIPAFLYRILAWRYDNDLLTVITSNEALATILDILGPRIKDRIRPSYTVATMEWDSYRKRVE